MPKVLSTTREPEKRDINHPTTRVTIGISVSGRVE